MEKRAYQAAPGVASVNGQAVAEDGTVHLTEAEALYFLGHGRISVPDTGSQSHDVEQIPSLQDALAAERDPPRSTRRSRPRKADTEL